METLFGGIEAGGTKFVCAVGTSPEKILAEERFSTNNPDETLNRCINFFSRAASEFGPVKSLGIGAFGPLDPNPESSTYGFITSTPKTAWKNTDVVGFFKLKMKIPIGFDTDVNGAALGEGRWGAAAGIKNFLYITVGTGIGGGIVVNKQLIHGLLHPEIGHIFPVQDKNKDPFPGVCPYHGNCLEGLAAGPAVNKRWGTPAEKLPADHPAWEIESNYLAQAAVTYILLYSPEKIIFGGGIMHQEQLFPLIRKKVQEKLAGYIDHPLILKNIDTMIVPPKLGDRAGICGAFILAEQALT